MRVSELITRLDEHLQRVGNVNVAASLSNEWEDVEGYVVDVKTEKSRASALLAQAATVTIEGYSNEDEDTPTAPARTMSVGDLIDRLTQELRSTGDVEVKLHVTSADPREAEIGAIAEVSSLRWTTTTLDGPTISNTDITIAGQIER